MNETLKKLIPLAEAHQRADEYKSGHYEWANGGACAIGCTVRDAVTIGVLPRPTSLGMHKDLECTGAPEWVWHLVDSIFERLPEADRPAWTPQFLRSAVDVNDWSRVKARFLIEVLESVAHLNPDAVRPVILLWQRVLDGCDPAKAEWVAAAREAREARKAAREAARAAAEEAARAAAAEAAAAWAAEAAAWALEAAAAAAWAAEAAAWALEAAAAAWALEAACLPHRDFLLSAMREESKGEQA